MEEDYDADHIEVDFRNATEAAKAINDHAEEQMRRKITNIIDKSSVEDAKDAHLVVTSAAYFKGRWKVCD